MRSLLWVIPLTLMAGTTSSVVCASAGSGKIVAHPHTEDAATQNTSRAALYDATHFLHNLANLPGCAIRFAARHPLEAVALVCAATVHVASALALGNSQWLICPDGEPVDLLGQIAWSTRSGAPHTQTSDIHWICARYGRS